jgi:hypothetical protein
MQHELLLVDAPCTRVDAAQRRLCSLAAAAVDRYCCCCCCSHPKNPQPAARHSHIALRLLWVKHVPGLRHDAGLLRSKPATAAV